MTIAFLWYSQKFFAGHGFVCECVFCVDKKSIPGGTKELAAPNSCVSMYVCEKNGREHNVS